MNKKRTNSAFAKKIGLWLYGIALAAAMSANAQPSPEIQRITLWTGEIFLAEIVAEENFRYRFNRCGLDQVIPIWRVTDIEPGVTELRSAEEAEIYPASGEVSISGRTIFVTSVPPVEASHLELYPAWTTHYQAPEQYLRGYLINHQEQGYRSIRVSLVFYDENRVRLYDTETQVFSVYGNTMKPFIVSTQFVDWSRARFIDIRPIGRSTMPRSAPGG